MQSPHLSLIHLPSCLGPPTVETREYLMSSLFKRYNVVASMEVVDGDLWCRYGKLIRMYLILNI